MAIGTAHRFSSSEFDRLVASGALADLRVELIEGVLVDVSPQGERHARMIQRLTALLASRAGTLRVQLPLAVEDGSRPEPDLAVVDPEDGDEEHPPVTARLVIEVAQTSHELDRAKAALYARARVEVYWLVDAPAAEIVEHRQPTADGYLNVRTLTGQDRLDAGLPGVEGMTVASLFTPRR